MSGFRYQSSKAHAPYCTYILLSVDCPGLQYFLHIISLTARISEKVIEHNFF